MLSISDQRNFILCCVLTNYNRVLSHPLAKAMDIFFSFSGFVRCYIDVYIDYDNLVHILEKYVGHIFVIVHKEFKLIISTPTFHLNVRLIWKH